MESTNNENLFPLEVWSHILSFTEELEVFRLQRVCKFFRNELRKRASEAWVLKLLHGKSREIDERVLFPKLDPETRRRHLRIVGRTNNNGHDDYYYLSKVIVAGPAGVGKTTFWESFHSEGINYERYPSNIGVEFCVRMLQTKDDLSVKLQVWDTAGAERFRPLSYSYFRGAQVILFMFALDDRRTLEDLVDTWFQHAFTSGNLYEKPAVCYLVGLKVDLKSTRAITRREGELVAKKYKMKYFEASGKMYNTVMEVMNSVIEDTVDAQMFKVTAVWSTLVKLSSTFLFEIFDQMGNRASSSLQQLANLYKFNSDILFEQLPHELNLAILYLLDSDTQIRLSCTCKRWMNNLKYADLFVSSKLLRGTATNFITIVQPEDRPKFDESSRLEIVLRRYDPENLRSLRINLDPENNIEAMNAFICSATNLTRLELQSVWYMDAVLKLPHDRLKELKLNFMLEERLTRFVNLERISFRESRSNYEQKKLEHITMFSKLRSLSICNTASDCFDYSVFHQLTHLKELRLESAYLEDGNFVMLSGLTNLEVLEMPYLQKEIPLDEMELKVNKWFLQTVGNRDPVSGLRHLTKLVNLTYLDISSVQPFDSKQQYDVAELVSSHFRQLKSINISCTNIGKANRDKLKSIPWLTVVDDQTGIFSTNE